MGIIKKTVIECVCDICQNPCSENDREIEIRVNNGDGRDVGPARIYGVLKFYQPYGCSDGIICFKCKIKFLKQYLDAIE